MSEGLFRKLLDNLKVELKLQNKLLELLLSEKNKIVHLQIDDLDQLRVGKEDLYHKLTDTKVNRNEIVVPLVESLISQDGSKLEKSEPEKTNLKEVFNGAPSEVKNAYHSISSELKKTLTAVQKLNTENSGLLRQSLGLVSSTISILTAKPQVPNNNYHRDGKVSSATEEEKSPLGVVSSFNRSA